MTQDTALNILKTGASVFLTGQAGSGKTYILNQYISFLKECGIYPAITASTGIASTHIGGVTIHAWASIGIKDSLSDYDLDVIESKKHIYTRIKNTKVLIIDEISMLHAHRLDMINDVLKYIKKTTLPFGGIQVVFCGDFFQLPPVNKTEEVKESDYIFNALSFKELDPVICYLKEQHRQKEDILTNILNEIRKGNLSETTFSYLDSRIGLKHTVPHTRLYTHNLDVDQINKEELGQIETEPYTYEMHSSGKELLIEALKKTCLAPQTLELKKNARVMFVKNDPEGKFVNGTLGIVEDFLAENIPLVRTNDGKKIKVMPLSWSVEDNGKILATVTQLPLRLAWAMTIHKSQGMSLDNAEIDLTNVFTYGQGYVALSRLTSIDGLSLVGLSENPFMIHPAVSKHDEVLKKMSALAEQAFISLSKEQIEVNQKKFISNIGGLWFDFESLPSHKKQTKRDTYTQTRELLVGSKSIEEVATIRNLTTTTILEHLEKLKKKDQLPSIEYLKPKKEIFDRVVKVFKKLKTSSLTPVMQELQKENFEITYEDLRLIRLFI